MDFAWLKARKKGIIAALAFVGITLTTLIQDTANSTGLNIYSWIVIGGSFVTAFGIYWVKNEGEFGLSAHAKLLWATALGVVTVLFTTLQSVTLDHSWDNGDTLKVVIAIATYLGVYQVKNTPVDDLPGDDEFPPVDDVPVIDVPGEHELPPVVPPVDEGREDS